MAGRICAVFIVAVTLAFAGPAFCGVFFADGFESGDTSNPYSVDGASWVGSSSSPSDSVSISNELAHSGEYSLKFFYAGNSDLSDDAWAEQRFTFGVPRDDVYVQFFIYFSENYIIRDVPSGPDNTKLGALWGATYSDPVSMAIEYETDMKPRFKTKVAGYPVSPDCSGAVGYVSNPLIQSTSTSISSMRGRWAHIEYHYKLDSGSGDGAFQMWIDGNLEVDSQNIAWSGAPCSPGYLLNGYLMGWSNSGFTQDTIVYIDDVTFSTERVGGTSARRLSLAGRPIKLVEPGP